VNITEFLKTIVVDHNKSAGKSENLRFWDELSFDEKWEAIKFNLILESSYLSDSKQEATDERD
jgi:hypothetical protein